MENIEDVKVRELMRDSVISCRGDDTVECAVARMYAHNVGSVVVVDNAGAPIGIFTERDLVRVVAEGMSLDTPLEKIARKELVAASPEESLVAVAHKMIERGIRHIPVVDRGRVIGVLSIRDVLRYLMAAEASYP